MNRANHRQESDRRPLWLCPVCLAKLTWDLGTDPAKRYEDLIKISDDLGLDKEKKFFEESLKVLNEK